MSLITSSTPDTSPAYATVFWTPYSLAVKTLALSSDLFLGHSLIVIPVRMAGRLVYSGFQSPLGIRAFPQNHPTIQTTYKFFGFILCNSSPHVCKV